MKRSNFSAARAHLERAFDYLAGNDEPSTEACIAIDLLIEVVTVAEHKRSTAEVMQLRRATSH